MLDVRIFAPNFELLDQDGKECSLVLNRGSYVLLYFYPKDDTPGCIEEACSIRDLYVDFIINDIKIFGISSDSIESHKKFAEKYDLPFSLLSDPEKKVIKIYGADDLSTTRISYLIGPDGIIERAYPKINPTKHGIEILEDFYDLYFKR